MFHNFRIRNRELKLLSVFLFLLSFTVVYPSGIAPAADTMRLMPTDPDTVVSIFDDSPIYSAEDSILPHYYVRVGEWNNSSSSNPVNLLLGNMPKGLANVMSKFLAMPEDRTLVKKIDLMGGIAPSYSREASFGLRATGIMQFRLNADSVWRQPSLIYASVGASLKGFYTFRSTGTILFRDGRSKFQYVVDASRKNMNFSGFSVVAANSGFKGKYDRREIVVNADYLYRLLPSWFLGPSISVGYSNLHNVTTGILAADQFRKIFTSGLGASIQFDTRDNYLYPTSGFYFRYQFMAFPAFMNNCHSSFRTNRLIANSYFRVWRGGILACDLFAGLTSSKTPWSRLEQVGADIGRIRGYILGSYTGRNLLSAQVEVRQHLFMRIGAVAWVGIGTLFDKFGRDKSGRSMQVWLPNGGVGLRMLLKKDLNARLDLGVGRKSWGAVLTFGEAF